jgi:hypothetical protein
VPYEDMIVPLQNCTATSYAYTMAPYTHTAASYTCLGGL